MHVGQVMTSDPARCEPTTNLQQVAKLMQDCDCGLIPVTEASDSTQLLGVVTDRDIVVRMVAAGRNPMEATAADCMSQPVTTVTRDTPIEDAIQLMESHQVRRLAVVDDRDHLVGIVAQADIALKADDQRAAEVVREVSRPDH